MNGFFFSFLWVCLLCIFFRGNSIEAGTVNSAETVVNN